MADWVDPYPQAPVAKIYEKRSLEVPDIDLRGPIKSEDEYLGKLDEMCQFIEKAGKLGHDAPEQRWPKMARAFGPIIHETMRRHQQRLRRHRLRGYKRRKATPRSPIAARLQKSQERLDDLKRRVREATERVQEKKENRAVGVDERWAEGWTVEDKAGGRTAILKRTIVEEEAADGKPGERRWVEEGWVVSRGPEGLEVAPSERKGREVVAPAHSPA